MPPISESHIPGRTAEKVEGEFPMVRDAIRRVNLRYGDGTVEYPRCQSCMCMEEMLR